jgi:hypothetical protein
LYTQQERSHTGRTFLAYARKVAAALGHVFPFAEHRALRQNLEVAILPSFEEFQTYANDRDSAMSVYCPRRSALAAPSLPSDPLPLLATHCVTPDCRVAVERLLTPVRRITFHRANRKVETV